MKVKVKNLGVLKQAEFSLGDLTIICGGNNTGKTYATYALYGFLDTWRHRIGSLGAGRIPQRIINNLLDNGVTQIDLIEYGKEAESILNTLCGQYTESLPSIFVAPRKRFRDVQFQISLEREALSKSIKQISFKRKIGARNRQFFSIAKAEGSLVLEASLLGEKQRVKIPTRLIKYLITETINEHVFEQFFPYVFISSAERTGAAIFRNELIIARDRMLEEMGSVRLRMLEEMGSADDDVDIRKRASRSYPNYPLPVKYNINFIRLIENIAKTDSFLVEEHPAVLMQFADIIGGSYHITRNDELYFIPKDTKVRLSMNESSSGVRSMLDIGLYLRHAAERGDLLMVDEPELNLHPENQRRIARLFARLANLGIKVFITTHSDYIIKELNTLIMLNQDKPHLKRIAQQEGYESSELVAPEKIKAYIAEEAHVLLDGNKRRSRCQTLVEAKIDQESGIEMGSFDETINKMNEIQEAIVWGEDE